MRRLLIFALCASVLLAACSLPKLRIPRVHKLTVQQGNVITQEMVDRLKPGMTRSQVAFVMGDPVFRNTFEADRWDYIYTIELPDVFSQEQRISLFFVEDVLAYLTGDVVPSDPEEAAADSADDADTPATEDDSATDTESSTETSSAERAHRTATPQAA